MSYFVYMVECRNRSLYVGQCSLIHRRIRQHAGELAGGAHYVRRHGFERLVYYELQPDRPSALAREAEIKDWHYAAVGLSEDEGGRLSRDYKNYLLNCFDARKLEIYERTQTNREIEAALQGIFGLESRDVVPMQPGDWFRRGCPIGPGDAPGYFPESHALAQRVASQQGRSINNIHLVTDDLTREDLRRRDWCRPEQQRRRVNRRPRRRKQAPQGGSGCALVLVAIVVLICLSVFAVTA